jgi:CheY-like chemotaxis protein
MAGTGADDPAAGPPRRAGRTDRGDPIGARGAGAPATVLVVGPDELRRHSVIGAIGGEGREVLGAGSAQAAVALLRDRRVDCLVLDGAIPRADGATLLAVLGAGPGAVAVPVVVADATGLDDALRSRLAELGGALPVHLAEGTEQLVALTAPFLGTGTATAAPQARWAGGDEALTGRRVLIVDDDVRNVFAVSAALEAQGMVVRYAENGRDGLAALEDDGAVDLVLMDIMMPGMDGYETMRAIRGIARFAGLPIVALTAKALPGDREKAIDAGASSYVTKPVDIDALLDLLREQLAGLRGDEPGGGGA